MTKPITVFITSWERPLYLWACLDSFYRNTLLPCRFVLIDSGSRDPLVHEIIAGFERREMFHCVHRLPENDFAMAYAVRQLYRDSIGDFSAHVESDVIIEKSDPCWLTRMVDLMNADEKLAMLGSYIDTSDFLSEERARRIEPLMETKHLRALIKFYSPERNIPESKEEVISPFTPPGRVLLLRRRAMEKLTDEETISATDSYLHNRMLQHGYRTGIATGVRHRHLSLLNLFDYPDYKYHPIHYR